MTNSIFTVSNFVTQIPTKNFDLTSLLQSPLSAAIITGLFGLLISKIGFDKFSELKKHFYKKQAAFFDKLTPLIYKLLTLAVKIHGADKEAGISAERDSLREEFFNLIIQYNPYLSKNLIKLTNVISVKCFIWYQDFDKRNKNHDEVKKAIYKLVELMRKYIGVDIFNHDKEEEELDSVYGLKKK